MPQNLIPVYTKYTKCAHSCPFFQVDKIYSEGLGCKKWGREGKMLGLQLTLPPIATWLQASHCNVEKGVKFSNINGNCQYDGGFEPRGSHNAMFPTLKVKWSERLNYENEESEQCHWSYSHPYSLWQAQKTKPSSFIDVLKHMACMSFAIKYNCIILFASCMILSLWPSLMEAWAVPLHCLLVTKCFWVDFMEVKK